MHDKGERVTLDTFLARVQEDLATLDLSRSSLWKLLLQNGYRFRSVDKRRILMEKPAVVSAHASVLRTMHTASKKEDLKVWLFHNNVPFEDMLKCCDHVCKLEQEFWANDRLMDDIGPFTIDMRSGSSDGDEE
ncbi:hypothetical protein FJT64_027779 [Amphibalanus amphitrite]|uniref:Uncharacterized protein n=1 Tax=Amphibalanus amphitrite TaxID=1232801 RepID=A0A6A4WBP1_AMPAM|nr:hypothetical protein FJT64_027779 [Amphibalanus amphitrite]